MPTPSFYTGATAVSANLELQTCTFEQSTDSMCELMMDEFSRVITGNPVIIINVTSAKQSVNNVFLYQSSISSMIPNSTSIAN